MTAPVIRQYTDAIPAKGQAQTTFDTNVNDWLDWTTLQFAPDLVAFGSWADQVRAALIAGNLPPLTGRQLDAVRVNAAANGVEFADVTAAGWALLDDANAAAQRATLGLGTAATTAAIPEQTQAVFNAGTDTTESTITAAKLDAKVRDELNATGAAPMFACRAWVNFNGTDTVAIRASGNVSSITDNGVGDYTINFATALPDANYVPVFSTTAATAGDMTRMVVVDGTTAGGATTKTVSALRIASGRSGAGTREDMAEINVAIFR